MSSGSKGIKGDDRKLKTNIGSRVERKVCAIDAKYIGREEKRR